MNNYRVLVVTFLLLLGMMSSVSASDGGKSYDNEPVTVKWLMTNPEEPDANIVSADGIFSTVFFNPGNTTLGNSKGMTGNITDINNVKVATGLIYQPATGKTDILTWGVKAAAGLTFTPTKVTGFVNRNGTDVENGVTISARIGEGNELTLGTFTALRSGKGISKSYDENGVAQWVIELSEAQQAALSGSDIFYLTSTIGVATGKDAIFGEVVIEGTVSGTVADVNKYTVSVAALPADGGTASIYPASNEYEEGSEVELSTTENFGYDFVNWTDADGNVVSEKPRFAMTVKSNGTYTANYSKVNTYVLDVNVVGGANGYMISYTPAYTEIDGKKMYEEGTKVIINASSNEILKFASWSDGQTSDEIVYTMDKEIMLTATYSAVDFLVGWDFMESKGNNSRVADFASEGNDAVVLTMYNNDSGQPAGWLEKSQFGAGGYEGNPGVVCWAEGNANGDVGNHHWQTKVDATNFTDMTVMASMVYNYNSYQRYDLQYSLDETSWTTIGSIVMPGTKKWTTIEANVPSDANNRNGVSFRWIADRTSKVDGTAAKNDGACLGAIYIKGKAKVIDDGKAPQLLYTVPANGDGNASASGRIVLTFDEKVQLTDAAKATLNGKEAVASASGKTVIVEYSGLDYSADADFVLYGGSVSDMTGNIVGGDIAISFRTKNRPAISKKMYDFIVPTDGTLAEAIAAANAKGKDNTERFRIFVMDGKYVLPRSSAKKSWTVTLSDNVTTKTFTDYDPMTYVSASNISIIGADYNSVDIVNEADKIGYYDGQYGKTGICEGIGNSAVLFNTGSNNYFQGITIRNPLGDAHGRDLAFEDEGDRTIMKDMRLWGYQDTYTSHKTNRYYFEGGVIRGRTDYMCGKGDVYYKEVTLQTVPEGYIAVPSQPKRYGYIYDNCTIRLESGGSYVLGRPWGDGTPIALFINTKMSSAPSREGWGEMSGGYPARFAEYNSQLLTGTTVDLSGRKTTFGSHTNCNNPILTAAEAAEYTVATVMGQDDGWDPTYYTEQAAAPANVSLTGSTLTWDDSMYALLYAVCKDGKVVAFTLGTSFTVDDTQAKWSVRSANEMGGLGTPSDATVTDGIHDAAAGKGHTDGRLFNAIGQQTTDSAKGIVIKNGKKFAR